MGGVNVEQSKGVGGVNVEQSKGVGGVNVAKPNQHYMDRCRGV